MPKHREWYIDTFLTGREKNNFFCSYFFEISNTTHSFKFFMVVIYFYIRSTEIKLRKERAPKIIPETTM
jgi:hypothetical protein